MNEKIMNGRELSSLILNDLKEKVNKLDRNLTLVVISVGDNPASKVYVKQKEKKALEIGYSFTNLHYDEISEEELISEIKSLNADPNVVGMIVQLPLPSYLDKNKILNTISPLKDVDGLTNTNFLRLIKKEECLEPCTPKGVITLLDYYKVPYTKLKVVIVGRSELVGLPLFHMLLNRNATVTLCHSKTMNLKSYTKEADLLIVAVGKPNLITKDMIKEGAILVDVGINRIDNKLCGDIEASCLLKASLMTPVPGGVGPMTVVSLMENVYRAYELGKDNYGKNTESN